VVCAVAMVASWSIAAIAAPRIAKRTTGQFQQHLSRRQSPAEFSRDCHALEAAMQLR
jgi:hypothetical protein